MALTKSQLLIRLRNKRAEFNTFVSRRDQLRKIQQSLSNDFGNNVRDSDDKKNRTQSDLTKGLSGAGASRLSSVNSKMNQIAEKTPNADVDIGNALSNIQAEINRCQSRINTLDAELRSLQNQYNNAV